MAARDLPNLGLKAFYAPGEDGWGDDMSLNLLKLSVLTQGGVIAKVAAVVGTPPDGDVYVLDEAHATNPNEVVVYDDGAPVYFQPSEGWLLYDRTEDEYLTFDGVAWEVLATGSGGGGGGDVEEAPLDGKAYARKDGDWEEIAAALEAGGWEIIEKRTISVPALSHDFVGLEGYDEFIVLIRNVTYGGGDNAVSLRVSTDNGATFFNTSENYVGITTGGAESESSLFGTLTSTLGGLHSGYFALRGNKAGAFPICESSSRQDPKIFVGSTDKINALRLITNSQTNTISGGTVTLMGLRSGAANDVVHPFRGCRAGRTANIAVGGASTIPWTSEVYDYGGWHDNATNNTRFTVPAGVKRVRITGQFTVQNPSGGQSFSVRKNGNASVQFATAQVGNSAYSFTVQHFDTGTIEVSPGDYFEAYSEGSGTLVPSRTFFQIEAVSDRVSRADLSPSINAQGGSYPLAAADDGNIVEITSAGAATVTIPANATTGISVGSTFSVVQIGAGVVTIQAAVGVTLNGVAEGSADITGQWGGVSLYKRATDEWVIQGAHGGVS